MAKMKSRKSISKSLKRKSPRLKGARNWASAQVRLASYSRLGFIKLCTSIISTLFIITFFSLWIGGFLPDIRKYSEEIKRNRLISLGFVIKKINVIGEGRLPEDDVKKILDFQNGDYLFDVEINLTQKKIEDLPWVNRALVRRLWPDQIVIQIVERQPFALWQYKGKVEVIDILGEVIVGASVSENQNLNLFVGKDAAINAANISEIILNFPSIAERVDSFVYVSENRWDIIMDKGNIRVLLSQHNLNESLLMLKNLHSQRDILDRKIGTIDLRLKDRLSLKPDGNDSGI
ncbi:MAG: FtsQ-type POTRA domain-containing protein [Hellea sp.]